MVLIIIIVVVKMHNNNLKYNFSLLLEIVSKVTTKNLTSLNLRIFQIL